MAMTKDSLLARFKAKMGTAATPEGQAIQDDVLGKMADAIIEEIQQNAVVTVQQGQTVATTGTAAAQSGSTTSPGTGSIQ
jgi:hypothetical protein